MSETDGGSATLPRKIVVSLRAGGVFFAAANVVCVAILVWCYLTVKLEPKTLAVTGSARKAIVSDLVTWSGTFTASDAELVKAYDALKAASDKVKAFLIAGGIPESDITFSAISTDRRYKQEIVREPPTAPGTSPPPPTVLTTDQVEKYTLAQSVSISSTDMARVPTLSRSITSLIKEGVEIDSDAPRYLYTKLSELKINMLAEATKDATSRAEQIINNANGRLGKLVEARMGVMQVNPKGVTATSAEGINDTSSYEKEITAVVGVRFEVR
ncbi:MAG TPA: SIMPL domain-containing protein [Planctomycetota bacterium]|nr:SIMPL domain-containing protein [Planctomycetota bacterium]